jgi:hypothetical protein
MAASAERKAVIKNADMSEDMQVRFRLMHFMLTVDPATSIYQTKFVSRLTLSQQDAIDCAAAALEKFSVEKEVAAFIKKEFDRK